MATFNKLYYMTLAGEKKINGVSVFINKQIIADSGIDTNVPIKVTAQKGKIIIEEETK